MKLPLASSIHRSKGLYTHRPHQQKEKALMYIQKGRFAGRVKNKTLSKKYKNQNKTMDPSQFFYLKRQCTVRLEKLHFGVKWNNVSNNSILLFLFFPPSHSIGMGRWDSIAHIWNLSAKQGTQLDSKQAAYLPLACFWGDVGELHWRSPFLLLFIMTLLLKPFLNQLEAQCHNPSENLSLFQ